MRVGSDAAGSLRILAHCANHSQSAVHECGVAESGLPFDRSAGFLRDLGPDGILNLTTRAGALDVSFTPAGTDGYDDLRRDAVKLDAPEGVATLVASLADIIRSKRAADREKDRLALPRLQELLERTSTAGRRRG